VKEKPVYRVYLKVQLVSDLSDAETLPLQLASLSEERITTGHVDPNSLILYLNPTA
jgi:hypothetical protein